MKLKELDWKGNEVHSELRINCWHIFVSQNLQIAPNPKFYFAVYKLDDNDGILYGGFDCGNMEEAKLFCIRKFVHWLRDQIELFIKD